MGEQADRGIAIGRPRRERFVRPLRNDRRLGEPFWRGEGGARIDDRHVEADDAGHRGERLRNVDRADQGQARRRRLDGQEVVDVLEPDHAALAPAQGGLQLGAKRIGADRRRLDKALVAVGQARDRDPGAPTAPCRIHRLEDVEAHQMSFST